MAYSVIEQSRVNTIYKPKVGFLIDMDGVIYRGSQLIKGADVFLRKLKSLRIPYMLLTNNSQGSRSAMALKLTHMGIPIKSYEIFNCSMATARFVARSKPNGSAYLIAETAWKILYAKTAIRSMINLRLRDRGRGKHHQY